MVICPLLLVSVLCLSRGPRTNDEGQNRNDPRTAWEKDRDDPGLRREGLGGAGDCRAGRAMRGNAGENSGIGWVSCGAAWVWRDQGQIQQFSADRPHRQGGRGSAEALSGNPIEASD